MVEAKEEKTIEKVLMKRMSAVLSQIFCFGVVGEKVVGREDELALLQDHVVELLGRCDVVKIYGVEEDKESGERRGKPDQR